MGREDAGGVGALSTPLAAGPSWRGRPRFPAWVPTGAAVWPRSGGAGLLRALAAIAVEVRDETLAQLDRWMLWLPVAFGLGAATYFGLEREPSLGLAALVAAAGAALAVAARAWGRSRALAIAATLAAVAVAGFADARLATLVAAAPVAPKGLGATRIEGWVVDVATPSAGRPRVIVAPSWIAGVAPRGRPARVRLTLRTGSAPEPGLYVAASAILDPPPGPASPGGHDFARDAWFERIGGVGLALTPLRERDPEAGARPAFGLRMEMALNRFRWRLAERLTADVRAVVGDVPGSGLAAAVTTSHQDALNPDEVEDLRASGLAHMLAIAGLHTAAVTGFVFLAIRLAVAAWPWLALRVSGKKLAALGGLLAACAYLAVSGAHPPARRAAITAGVAFLAILCDRRAVSLRSLALAALLILALQPVSVVEPGFQMSFCASAALVAMAEVWPRRGGAISAPWFIAWPQRLGGWLVAMLAVSLVAGAATAPFAIQHFNRMASYGLFANFGADFVASAVMMPALAIAGLGETLGAAPGLLQPFLFIAGWSGRAIVAIAHLFATAPGASHSVSSAPPLALVVAFLGIVFACLWRGRLRWLAAPLAGAVLLWPRPPAPVAWIAPEGRNAAVVVDGRAVVLKPAVGGFESRAWAQRRGLVLPFAPDLEAALAYDCDRTRCVARSATRPAIGAWWTRRTPSADAMTALCRASDILILRAPTTPPDACRGVLVLGPDALARGGAAEVYPDPAGGWRIAWAEPLRGRRPWTSDK